MGSIAGSLVYAALTAVVGAATFNELDADKAMYIAALHFILPLGVVYTVSTNSPPSRVLIGTYFLILSAATLLGKGVLGEWPIDPNIKGGATLFCLAAIMFWLLRSPKMRYYYALIAGHPIPEDLVTRSNELEGRNWITPRARMTIEWLADRLETFVIVGFIAVVVYAYMSTG